MARRKRGASRWSWSTGERGVSRVRVFKHPRSGLLYLEWFEQRPGQRPLARTRNLGHADQARAKAEAFDFAAQLLRRDVPRKAEPMPEPIGPLTLGELFDNYLKERSPEKASDRHDRRAIAMFEKLWGRARIVRSLSERDWNEFIRKRRSGELMPPKKEKRSDVRDRVIEQDLKLLRAMLNWATRLKDPNGDFRLVADPLRGLPIPREANPVRTVLPDQEYEKLLEVAQRVDARFALALVLCAETSHRIQSVRSLRWSDIDLTTGVVKWPAEFDKIENEHETPLSDAALGALKAYRAREKVLGLTWVFPGRDGPLQRTAFYRWWRQAYEVAELTRPRGAFHTLRRKFATDRLSVPLKTRSVQHGERGG